MRRRIITCVLVLFAGATAFADDGALSSVERLQVIVLDGSGSMRDARHHEAMKALDEAALRWRDGPGDVVVAVAFNTGFAVGAAGPPAALDRISAACPTKLIRAPSSASLLDWLRSTEPCGLTRLYDTVADVLPAIAAFDRADLVLTIVTDGEDNQSARTADDLARELEALFTRHTAERRSVDVYFLRYERANDHLVGAVRDIAAASAGHVVVHDEELDAAPLVAIEVPDVVIPVDPSEDSESWQSHEFEAVFVGVHADEPLTAELVDPWGFDAVTVTPTTLVPGDNRLRLVFRLQSGHESSFIEDAEVGAVVRLATPSAAADVNVAGTIPAGWRVWKPRVLTVIAALAVLAVATVVLAALRGSRWTRGTSG